MDVYISATFVLFIACSSAEYNTNLKLKRELLSPERYDPVFRPVNNTSTKIEYHLVLNYAEILLIESEQMMTFSFWIEINWIDEFLTWDPNLYEGITDLTLLPSTLWTPHFGMFNSIGDFNIQVNDRSLLSVNYTGMVLLEQGMYANIECIMDITKFPFDVQVCEFHIIDLYMTSDKTRFKDFELLSSSISGSQWMVLSHTGRIVEKFGKSAVQFQFIIKRLPDFYLITLVTPLIVSSLLNPMVILIPASSGETVSVAVTILLSYTVFLNVVSGILPKTSSSISVLSVYIMILQGLSAVYTIICIILVKMDIKHNLFNCLRKRSARVDPNMKAFSSKETNKEYVKVTNCNVQLLL
ncbi:hypothetical protein LOTGIDRAFT_169051 [Lottia gigantea]|uniref:Neurotransmitter-gated ion-channel ligand-binding domain-containing protein n=1 Tax=Lottia gigantea TaxID=225164 RepID=V3ZMZ3_LOTGI|nr:hypothetical protein LOTGIDRAFT_169051 [Lottia gigantea]ESO83815.1 hypothetical protein LOTGIDRAFT_169051 [Lottia gigantea]